MLGSLLEKMTVDLGYRHLNERRQNVRVSKIARDIATDWLTVVFQVYSYLNPMKNLKYTTRTVNQTRGPTLQKLLGMFL